MSDRTELCDCGDGSYDPEFYSSCYDCYSERREEYDDCIFCGRWHSPRFATCFRCRESDPGREEAGRSLRWLILARDQHTCWACGESGPEVEVDHVIPCRSGGTARPWNLQALCRPCNQEKGDTWWVGSRWDKRRGELLSAYFMTLRSYLTEEERSALAKDVWTWRAEHATAPEWPRSLPARSTEENLTENFSHIQVSDGDAPDVNEPQPSSMALHPIAAVGAASLWSNSEPG